MTFDKGLLCINESYFNKEITKGNIRNKLTKAPIDVQRITLNLLFLFIPICVLRDVR